TQRLHTSITTPYLIIHLRRLTMVLHPISTLFPYTTLFRSANLTITGADTPPLEEGTKSLHRGFIKPGVQVKISPLSQWERGLIRWEEHTSELQSRGHLLCGPLLEKKNRVRCDLW